MEDVHKFRTVNWSPNGHNMSGAPQFVYDRMQRHWAAMMKVSLPFEVGKTYKRMDGMEVICIEVKNDHKGYECALFTDYYTMTEREWEAVAPGLVYEPGAKFGWRYNRPEDRGRCTGSRFDLFKTVVPDFPADFNEEEWK